MVNPWEKQRVSEDRTVPRAEDGGKDKRPFTDEEVTKLLVEIPKQSIEGAGVALPDMCMVAALTGGRRDEVATLRVRHIDLLKMSIRLPGEKNENAFRLIPIHPDLQPLMERRCAGRQGDDFIFHELPDQQSDARGRGAPITQAFTRVRRRLGVDEMLPGRRQSRIDFHSWRRWFIRKAVEALEDGATGYTQWTIADVVGHSNEDGPLGETMGRYPGRASDRAMRACVEAVRLPEGHSHEKRGERDEPV
jgi:integrase